MGEGLTKTRPGTCVRDPLTSRLPVQVPVLRRPRDRPRESASPRRARRSRRRTCEDDRTSSMLEQHRPRTRRRSKLDIPSMSEFGSSIRCSWFPTFVSAFERVTRRFAKPPENPRPPEPVDAHASRGIDDTETSETQAQWCPSLTVRSTLTGPCRMQPSFKSTLEDQHDRTDNGPDIKGIGATG
jgi:hypothetical protein